MNFYFLYSRKIYEIQVPFHDSSPPTKFSLFLYDRRGRRGRELLFYKKTSYGSLNDIPPNSAHSIPRTFATYFRKINCVRNVRHRVLLIALPGDFFLSLICRRLSINICDFLYMCRICARVEIYDVYLNVLYIYINVIYIYCVSIFPYFASSCPAWKASLSVKEVIFWICRKVISNASS